MSTPDGIIPETRAAQEIKKAPASFTPPSSSHGELQRYVVVALVVGAWMALGYTLHTDANTYLLLGVPLLFGFQRFIAGRPISALWFSEPQTFVLPIWAWVIAAAFMILPVTELIESRNHSWPPRLWLVCAAAGAVPLAWSLARCTRAQWREFAFCLTTAGTMGVLTVGIKFALHPSAVVTTQARVLIGLRSLALYVPVCFVIEEVFFRGGLDSYLARGRARAPWLSAFYLSALWGWWHLPIMHLRPEHRGIGLLVLIIVLPLIHCAVGVFLSVFFRRSGMLLVPVLVHAFIDAVRNALQ